jgi:hypothetical protein
MTTLEEVKDPIGRHQHPEAEHSLPLHFVQTGDICYESRDNE